MEGSDQKVHKVELRHISKSFGKIQALRDVSLKLSEKEILGLVGDNAAGKSTLLKILAGAYQADEGEIYVNGEKVEIENPIDAQKAGIEIIYQDFMIAPNLDISANIFLGRELVDNLGLMKRLKKNEMRKQSKETLSRLGFEMEVDTLVVNLSGGQQQTVAISRALHFDPAVILMDEPTASLSLSAVDGFLAQVKDLREKHGSSIIYVSHRIPEVLEISDRILVLRRGEIIGELIPEETDIDEIVKYMTGSSLVKNGSS